ncbi:MAG: MinD/ParA family protein, partial [Deltaproteobacteria bacterium]|nr:MinD/ParA family protein [Deltaproteobacteria bacterium]
MKIISVHSYRGGTGKSNLVANLGVILAKQGKSVGMIDTDFQSPGLHILFGLDDAAGPTINDFLWGYRRLPDVLRQVTPPSCREAGGNLFLGAASMKPAEIARILKDGYDVTQLQTGIEEIEKESGLDYLLIDTHPGLCEETLLCIAISDALIVLLRPDQQDYRGTAVTLKVVQQLEVPILGLVLNKIPEELAFDTLHRKMEEIYGYPVWAMVPHSNPFMLLGSAGLFSLSAAEHLVTKAWEQLAEHVCR